MAPHDILRYCLTVKTLAASLRHFTRFIGRFIPLPRAYTVLCRFSASAAKLMRERRERNPCRDPIRFNAVLYTLTLASSYVFYTVFIRFSLFFELKTASFFSIYFRFRKPRNLQFFDNVRAFSEKFLGKIPR
jgi:hypothetical protein